jgi:phosphoglycolate phosphatase
MPDPAAPSAFPPLPFDIVGFDLDGTLVDSSADLAAAVNHAFARFDMPPHSLADVKRFVGKGVRVLIERALRARDALTDERLSAMLPVFMDYYETHVCDLTEPYPGAIHALDALDARGTRVAICTNKAERFTFPLLAKLGLDSRFGTVICGDTLGPGVLKPDPAPLHAMVARAGGGRAVFLGDTSNDIDAARAAEIASIAVRFGFVDDADRLGADATLAHFDDLLPLLANWPHRRV